MSNLNIAVLIGSIQADSINAKLFDNMKKNAPESLSFNVLDIKDLPLYNQDLEADFPENVKTLKTAIEAADGILFVTPEHNRSITAALKNAIDWASRPWGSNSFEGKPSAIAGASMGLGTYGAQSHLRDMLTHLNAPAMHQPVFYFNPADKYDETGIITDPETIARIKEYLSAFETWINKVK